MIYLLVFGGIGFYVWSLRGSSGPKKAKSEPPPDDAAQAPTRWSQGALPGSGDPRDLRDPRYPRDPRWGV